MAAIALLHGGGTTGRQWDLVLERLAGPAVAPNVPGRLDRPGDPATLTLAEALDSVAADVPDGDVVLVAHSSGGLLVPGLVDRLPVVGVVWIAASIPPEGGSGMECMQPRHREGVLALQAHSARTGEPMVTPPAPPERERMRSAYGGDPLTDEQLDFALDPTRWVSDTYNFYFEAQTLAGVRDLPRLYVRTLRDRAVPIDLQDEMAARVPGTPTVALDVGHVPMITMPDVVAALVEGFVADVAR